MSPDAADLLIAIQPPGHAVFTAGDESLVCSVLNALAGVRVRVAARFMHLDGRVEPIVDTFTPATDRSVSVKRIALANGWLLNAQVAVVAGAPLTGQTFAVLSLARGRTGAFEELATFAAGPISAVHRVAWPGSPIQSSIEGAGALRSIAGAVPAAGAEIAETVPTGARWELITFEALLTTSAAVANRVPQLVIDDGATPLYRVGAALNQAASLAHRRSWFQGAPAPYLDNALNVPMPLPANVRLGGGFRIRTITTALDALDQYSSIQYLVREWIEGA